MRHKSEWLIVYGHGHEDVTEACTKHVGALLTDALVHHVYPRHSRTAVCSFIPWWKRVWLTLTSREYREATHAHS